MNIVHRVLIKNFLEILWFLVLTIVDTDILKISKNFS